MVQHPGHLLKTCETERPISFQNIVPLTSSVIPLGLLCFPKSLRRHVTKSAEFIPSLLCALTEASNASVMSNRASASATCSLGFCTERHQEKTGKNQKLQVVIIQQLWSQNRE